MYERARQAWVTIRNAVPKTDHSGFSLHMHGLQGGHFPTSRSDIERILKDVHADMPRCSAALDEVQAVWDLTNDKLHDVWGASAAVFGR